MGVTLLEFSQIETGERLRQSHGLIDIAMQQRNRQCQFLMMFARMIQPLLAMGTAWRRSSMATQHSAGK